MKLPQIKATLAEIKNSGLSMKRRLAVYIAVLLMLFLVVIGIALSFLGILNITPFRLRETFHRELKETNYRAETSIDTKAAHAILFAEHLSKETEHYLAAKNISFEALENNAALIDGLEAEVYNIVAANMQYADCSGAFFMLNTTVNSKLPEKYHSGIYLKFSYLHSNSMINHKTSMLYGSSAVAKEYGADYYNEWHLEMPEGIYHELDDVFHVSKADFNDSYVLTGVYQIPGTWENVRFLCVPVFDTSDKLIGICGFEISSLYFSLTYETHNDEFDNIIHGLFTESEKDSYTGQMSVNHSGYSPSDTGVMTIKKGKNLDTFTYGNETFIGKYGEITLGNSKHILTVMVPEKEYQSLLSESYIRMLAVLIIVLMLMVLICLYFSHKYMKPILKSFEHIKTNSVPIDQVKIPEINDLFRFLADKDKGHEDEITELTRLRNEAKDEYTKIQTQLDKVVERHKSGADPEFYEIFKSNVSKLTQKEAQIFRLYLEGKTAKEIQEITEINQNTLKYHNKNLYSKLGVTSRKELLLYAAMLKKEGGVL